MQLSPNDDVRRQKEAEFHDKWASDVDLAQLSYRDAVDASREETNRRYLEAVMRRFRGDVSKAATHAGVERESFYRLLRRCGISADDFREDRRTLDGSKN